MTKLRKQQEEIAQNHKYENVRKQSKAKPLHREYKIQNLMVVKHTDVQMTKMLL
jgi:hypothetical protein